MRTKLIALIISALLTACSCAGRLPTQERATKIITHHINRYGKKYKRTIYHDNTVKKVEILNMEELHKGLIFVVAFITLDDGTIKKVRYTMEKGPFGWRYKSWEVIVQ